jgi:ssDNA-binding Zn-finger/Zn-ribbon topoisomerase 1
MEKNSDKILCEKCGTEMIKKESQKKESSGHQTICSSPNISCVSTSTFPISNNIVRFAPDKEVIRIIEYVCPSCEWEDQIRL